MWVQGQQQQQQSASGAWKRSPQMMMWTGAAGFGQQQQDQYGPPGGAAQAQMQWGQAADAGVVQPPVAKRIRPTQQASSGGGAVGDVTTGEVRFNTAEAAQEALMLNGTDLGGGIIAVQLDERSKDGTKVHVSGVPSSLDWGSLKTHFASCGKVEYANVKKVTGTPCVGQARFETPEEAQTALTLSGTVLGGHEIAMKLHSGSKDGTKVQIFNLPSNIEWQELKEFFMKAGLTPVFADISSSSGGSISAEVRYDFAENAATAIKELNGSILGGGQISIQADSRSQDGSKLFVTGIPPGIEWQELKDHFGTVGSVAFVKTSDQVKGGGKGFKGDAGKGMMMQQGMHPMMGGANYGNPFMQMMWQRMQQQTMWKGGGGGGCGGGSRDGMTGEVRFDVAGHAQMAVNMLNGSKLKGGLLHVGVDLQSHDGSKLWVAGIAPGTTWQELKDHFSWVGQVAYASVKN